MFAGLSTSAADPDGPLSSLQGLTPVLSFLGTPVLTLGNPCPHSGDPLCPCSAAPLPSLQGLPVSSLQRTPFSHSGDSYTLAPRPPDLILGDPLPLVWRPLPLLQKSSLSWVWIPLCPSSGDPPASLWGLVPARRSGDFRSWRQLQRGRRVSAAGKTFMLEPELTAPVEAAASSGSELA